VKKRQKIRLITTILLLLCLAIAVYVRQQVPQETPNDTSSAAVQDGAIPAYSGSAYVAVNGNVPYFTDADYSSQPFETYSELDELGRCGTAYANVGQELMPTEARDSIGSIKPSGWQTARYDGVVDGNYLYNRCHLIGFQLTGENANDKNLITGTRYLNIDGMLPFENLVADYVKETDNHVLYRVTPIFQGDYLVADGVLMEGYSVEDQGDGVCFCVFAYNVQPGVEIDYATGESALASDASLPSQGGAAVTYVANTSGKTFHLPSCSSVDTMKPENKLEFTGTREELIAQGYSPCGRCHP